MPAALDVSNLGRPVAIGAIARELKTLWETGSGATTRASLINFAVYCHGAEAMAANTEIISRFTRSHACRALLIGVDRDAPEPRISAWINAHCHLSRAGAKQICCEQISFLLEGAIKGRLTNIVFAHLDSDLPLCLWWQGDPSEEINPQLWPWIDRLIIDSLAWQNPRAQFARLRASIADTKSRLALRDLNWTRSLFLRQAISQIFDHPENLPHLAQLERVAITHAPEHRSTALLLLGWLAGQLGWKIKIPADPSTLRAARAPAPSGGRGLASEGRAPARPESAPALDPPTAENGTASPSVAPAGDDATFTSAETDAEIRVHLHSAPGAAISACELRSPTARFAIQRERDARYIRTDLQLPGDHEYHYLLPAGPDEIVDLLDQEMSRNSRDHIYLKALGAAEPLL